MRTQKTVSRKKGRARGGPGGSVEPGHPPLGPIFHVSLPPDLPMSVVGDSLKYSPLEPPFGGYIRRRRAPLNKKNTSEEE
jgi:hypothetical protein